LQWLLRAVQAVTEAHKETINASGVLGGFQIHGPQAFLGFQAAFRGAQADFKLSRIRSEQQCRNTLRLSSAVLGELQLSTGMWWK